MMVAAIPKLRRRVEELRILDPHSVEERGDPRFDAIVHKIDDTLAGIFGQDSIEYRTHRVGSLDTASVNMLYGTPIHEVRDGYRRGIERAISTLQTIIDLFEEKLEDQKNSAGLSGYSSVNSSESRQTPQSHKIFIVHGHSDGLLHEIARFLEKLNQEIVVLRERPSSGKTIIEKFVEYSNVSYAVVLLTPDDRGAAASEPFERQHLRARQNVIFELGYFIGKLGRDHVTALYQSDVEIPSDYSGVAFVPLDTRGAWKFELAKELKNAGFDIDMNLAC
jgi:predicted nucleotide-binding protein